MYIEITDQTNTITEEQLTLLEQALTLTANMEAVNQQAELSVSIVTNEEIKDINHQFRNKDMATDVLSFPLDDAFGDQMSDVPLIIGDIIISIDKVKEQSTTYEHSFERELVFLSIHGFLHILGYTHDEQEEERVMLARQEEILKELNLERE